MTPCPPFPYTTPFFCATNPDWTRFTHNSVATPNSSATHKGPFHFGRAKMAIRTKLTRLTVVAALITTAVIAGSDRSNAGVRSRSAQIAASRLRANLARRVPNARLQNQMLKSQKSIRSARRSTANTNRLRNLRLPNHVPMIQPSRAFNPRMYKEGDPVRRNYRMYKEGDPIRRGIQLNVRPNIRRPNVRQQYVPWVTVPQNTLH